LFSYLTGWRKGEVLALVGALAVLIEKRWKARALGVSEAGNDYAAAMAVTGHRSVQVFPTVPDRGRPGHCSGAGADAGPPRIYGH